MDFMQFQYLASRLTEHGAYPVEFRTAISRSYYAVFHSGLNFLNDMGFSIPDNSEAHHDVYEHLNNSGVADLVKVATKMNDLRSKRNHADYDLRRSDVESKENAKMLVQSAERIIETMKKSCNGKDRSQIISNIKKWKRRISK